MCPRGLSNLKELLKGLKSRNRVMPTFYAVARGREVGVFQSWNTCKELTNNFPGAKFKKFEEKESAWNFVQQYRNKFPKTRDEDGSFSPKQLPQAQNEGGPSIPQQDNIVTLSDSEEDDVVVFKNEESKKPSSTFDFEAFNLRLTNLENSYQEKIRSLEERLSALENIRMTGDSAQDGDQSTERSASARNSKVSATKRKLLDTAGDIIKPGTSRSYSTSALKKIRTSDEKMTSVLAPPSTTLYNVIGSNGQSSIIPFQVDDDDYVMVYTDGACSKNGHGIMKSKAGIGVWFNDGHPMNVSAPVKGRPTNNVAEFQACIAAAERAEQCGIKKLCIFTDSKFVITCMTSWMMLWKRNDWKTAGGKPVINKEQILELEQACKAVGDVKYVWVKGHRGNRGNEGADYLARKGAESYKPDHAIKMIL